MEKEFDFAAVAADDRYNPSAPVSERVDWLTKQLSQHVYDVFSEKLEFLISPVQAYKWNLRNLLILLDELGEWTPIKIAVNIRVSSQYVTFAPTKPLNGPHPYAQVTFDLDQCMLPHTEGLPSKHPLSRDPEDEDNATYGGIGVLVPTWKHVPVTYHPDETTGALVTGQFTSLCNIRTNMDFCEPVIRAFCGPRPEHVPMRDWWEEVYNTTGCENSLMMAAIPTEALSAAAEFVNPNKKTLSGHGDASAVLAVREDTPVEIVTKFTGIKYRKDVRLGAAMNMVCPLDVAKTVGDSYAEAAVVILDDRDDITPELLRDWADSQWIKVRLRVAEHPLTPPDALELLVLDDNEYVRAYAAANPNTPQRARTVAHISTSQKILEAVRPF